MIKITTKKTIAKGNRNIMYCFSMGYIRIMLYTLYNNSLLTPFDINIQYTYYRAQRYNFNCILQFYTALSFVVVRSFVMYALFADFPKKIKYINVENSIY